MVTLLNFTIAVCLFSPFYWIYWGEMVNKILQVSGPQFHNTWCMHYSVCVFFPWRSVALTTLFYSWNYKVCGKWLHNFSRHSAWERDAQTVDWMLGVSCFGCLSLSMFHCLRAKWIISSKSDDPRREFFFLTGPLLGWL